MCVCACVCIVLGCVRERVAFESSRRRSYYPRPLERPSPSQAARPPASVSLLTLAVLSLSRSSNPDSRPAPSCTLYPFCHSTETSGPAPLLIRDSQDCQERKLTSVQANPPAYDTTIDAIPTEERRGFPSKAWSGFGSRSAYEE